MKPTSVTLIITTYNRKEALELVLLSAFQQSVLPTEIIVADDGSRRDTAELVNFFQAQSPVPLIHCWHEDKGFRVGAIRNKAIAMASSSYIIIVDGDIILHRHFVKSHITHAAPKRLIQGSRVFIEPESTFEALIRKKIRFNFFSKGIRCRYNTIHFPSIARLISYQSQNLKRVRACNQSFWKKDMLLINGFNENFEGWGFEDTEFTLRMLNNGIQFYKMKWIGVCYHLHHAKSSRERLAHNRILLEETVTRKLKRCENGIDKYLAVRT